MEDLQVKARELYLPATIERISKPSSLEFMREYVAKNVPVIITGLIDEWPAMQAWSLGYLEDKLKDTTVTVSQTPNGRADAVTWSEQHEKAMFVMPHEERMPFPAFCRRLRENADSTVDYIQYQNSNFVQEFEDILAFDVQPEGAFAFASEAFAMEPDAVNIWIGGSDSVSSMHKDHYENIYAVLAGKKHFTLLPPTSRPFLPIQRFEAGKWVKDESGKFAIEELDMEAVPWIAVDPDSEESSAQFPSYKEHCRPLRVTLEAGEVLYLPSLWYHQVSQTADPEGKVVAMNWWYDMQFDIKYAYFSMLEALAPASDYVKAATLSTCGKSLHLRP